MGSRPPSVGSPGRSPSVTSPPRQQSGPGSPLTSPPRVPSGRGSPMTSPPRATSGHGSPITSPPRQLSGRTTPITSPPQTPSRPSPSRGTPPHPQPDHNPYARGDGGQKLTYEEQFSLPTVYTRRPGFNTTGQKVNLNLNAYGVLQYPTATVYQYDVSFPNCGDKRALQRKVWNSKARKDVTGPAMIWDGHKLAWSLKKHDEIRLLVDLNQEEGRPAGGPNNTFRLQIRPTRVLDIGLIKQYIEGRVQYSKLIGEALSFFDHLLREGPSSNPNFIPVKRSFFKRDAQRADLGGGIEVWRGVYQALRVAQGGKLVLNIDVANTCFWKPVHLTSAIVTKWREIQDPNGIAHRMRSDQSNGAKRENEFHKLMNRVFKGVVVTANYPGNPMAGKEWKIYRFSLNNANEEKIAWRDLTTRQPTGEMVSIAVYFKRKYNTALQYPNLPLVEMTKKDVMYPMEFLKITVGQRYSPKLDEIQTANMIKFAVSPPNVRLNAINECKSWLDWDNDIYLKNYGLRLNHTPIKTEARLLPAPSIKFGNQTVAPGTRGRWDLKGKKFLTSNPQELVSWGIGVFSGRTKVDKSQVDKFALDFARAYRAHGGQVGNKPPFIKMLVSDAGEAVYDLHQSTGNHFQRRPQLLIFLVQDRNAFHYTRIKKSCDCRFGVVSQVMQLQQVLKGNPQYYSNVLMKVNAKLGGTTAQSIPHPSSGFKSFGEPTMIIGADVSHASAGSHQASTAAMTVSFDRFAGRYAAGCQSNGIHTEIISEANMRGILRPLVSQWMSQVGGGRIPSHVYYIRDGVSVHQCEHVMQQEVPYIKAVMDQCNNNQPWDGKLTVIIATKRHHVRSFPDKNGSDPKGNPLPGCLIERDVTYSEEFDFYLYSHIALQGTSRPVHYSVLRDDANLKPEVLQNMIYDHCYQYMRSTTSVSLHPAVYYAHLASNRAKAHEDLPATAGPQGGPGYKQNKPNKSTEPSETEVKPLLPMHNVNGIVFAMWYI